LPRSASASHGFADRGEPGSIVLILALKTNPPQAYACSGLMPTQSNHPRQWAENGARLNNENRTTAASAEIQTNFRTTGFIKQNYNMTATS